MSAKLAASDWNDFCFQEQGAHQEGNGSVHVEVLEVKAEEAHPSSKGPRVGEVVVDPQGQRQDMGQVGHCQVDHEDHRLGVLAVEKKVEL